MKFTISLLLLGMTFLTPICVADTAPANKTGLKIGAKAPASTLKDQTGKQRSLAELGKGYDLVALVFHRSASW